MCACKDKACAHTIGVKTAEWVDAHPDHEANAAGEKQAAEALQRFTGCADKLRASSFPAPPDVAAPPADAKVSPTGVHYKILHATGGARPAATDTVKVHYTGWTTDGNMFDSSVERGQPIEFPLRGVIPGWTDGMQQVGVGEKVRLWIPEALAYQGRPGMPAGMLVFDVELLEIVKP
ncbi:MAG: FKBP-type peptidyl-prolyl cis-trans isomerase [Deltaproteobacteria bacterium]|nr:FKBP-type peptidyl-prolyl cis-trans isomerase [Deltaproteobacteria bacterium]